MTDTDLLDCGHYATPAGICQYDGCGGELCEKCITVCTVCHAVLCSIHRTAVGNDDHDVCPDDRFQYLVKNVANSVLDR